MGRLFVELLLGLVLAIPPSYVLYRWGNRVIEGDTGWMDFAVALAALGLLLMILRYLARALSRRH